MNVFFLCLRKQSTFFPQTYLSPELGTKKKDYVITFVNDRYFSDTEIHKEPRFKEKLIFYIYCSYIPDEQEIFSFPFKLSFRYLFPSSRQVKAHSDTP